MKYKDRFMYYFSHAHLLDLQRDKTEKKFEDLKFMGKYVDYNYLLLEWKENFVNVKVATPEEAFLGLAEDKPIIDYFNFDELFDDEVFNSSPAMQLAKEVFKKQFSSTLKLNLASNLDTQPEAKELWQKLIPDLKDEYTLKEWMQQFSHMSDALFNDKSVYKDLRRFALDELQLSSKYNIDIESINFNDDLRGTPIQQSFLDFVEKAKPNNDRHPEHKELDYFTTAYNCLNILGIDKEPNKKAKFINTFHDSLHAYYAAHCDYLISEDEGLLLKAKVIFKLLNIDTKVLHVNDFEKTIGQLSGIIDEDAKSYLTLLRHDLSKGLVINNKQSLRYNREYTTIKASQNHFGFFNRLDYIRDQDDGLIVVLYRDSLNLSKFTSYKEFEAVTNKIVKVMGLDKYLKGEYTEEDTEQIINGEWCGRTWEIDEFEFCLEINKGTNKFSFSIIL
ncbi:hypothetical protein [Rufibacter quisquiliarum]|uniref:Uncharacterized protein n=1 Tax=Rufibacter quisquiliarum TaxID=1549639 RepID=A0A839GTJ7_9BACT|nr:hypothetical protein [Rufibacter quisquiliarum]MBA9078785.1 hypothetical protein [Rufibacter quisquiliarum]